MDVEVIYKGLLVVTLGFLVLRWLVTFANFVQNPKLPHAYGEVKGKLSVLIPARNEERNLKKTLQSIAHNSLEQLEVIVLNDASTDNTLEIASQFAASDSRFKVINGLPLPADWLGKNWACHQLAQAATGDFLLFLDADVFVKKGLFTSAMAEMEAQQLALLSIFPDQEMQSFGERIVVPVMHYILLTLLPLQWIRRMPFPSMAAANGQFMLFRKAIYQKYHPHQLVRKQITEDIAIVQLLKKAGERAGTYLGNGLVVCRMYHNFREGVEGFSKNLLAGFGNSIAGLLVFLFLIAVAPLPLFHAFPETIIAVAGLVISMEWMLGKMSNQPVWFNILFHPFKIAALVWIGLLSIWKKTNGKNQWKGRSIN